MHKALGLASLLVLCATVLLDMPAAAQTHNFWTSGASMPTAVGYPMAIMIGGKIYVVGGATATAIVAENQIYNPVTNTWSAGAAIPVATADGAIAVVKNILYIFGGTTDGRTGTNAVWAYNPKTNIWSSKATMPTSRASAGAAVENGIVYVIGGTDGQNRFSTVESYNPATNSWTEEAPLLVGKSEPSVGLLKMSVGGTIVQTIVAADGFTTARNTGDNEAYNVSSHSWTSLTPDPQPRNEACTGPMGGRLFVAGGSLDGSNATNVNDVFTLAKNTWTPRVSMPQSVTGPGSAMYKGLLYCFGGSSSTAAFLGNVFNYVQIYHP